MLTIVLHKISNFLGGGNETFVQKMSDKGLLNSTRKVIKP